SVLDYIPETEHAAIFARTSSYDCATAFQNAANIGRGVFVPRGLYKIGSTVNLVSCPILLGEGFSEDDSVSTIILWTGGTSAMFEVRNTRTQIRGLRLHGNNIADCAIQGLGGNSSVFDCLTIMETRSDGIRFDAFGNNSLARVSNSVIRDVGTTFSTGTASNEAGASVVMIEGAGIDLSTLPIRAGLDLVRVGAGPAHTITGVGSDGLFLSRPLPAANDDASYRIMMGHGVAIPGHGDNSVICVDKVSFINCKASGLRDNGSFGAHARDNAYEACGYGRVIGRAGNVNRGAIEIGGYFEGSTAGADIMIEAGTESRTEPALSDVPAFENIYFPDPANVGAPVVEILTARAAGKVQLMTNETNVNVDFGGVWHFVQSSAAPNCTINLPAVNGLNRKSLFSQLEARILLLFMNIGGRTFTIKSPDTDVNGVAGTTGIAVTGSWIKREARLDPGYGWIVTG
ncbi:MAG: hypothetical protein QOC65_202, partial [Sphingomonadales bacterium]|nr:hypothetical protein [Sphingomonadales bacterium]